MMETQERRTVLGGWVTARLNRAKRIVPFKRLWQRTAQKARVLSPEEAAAEIARHQALIDNLAPGMEMDKKQPEEAGHGN